MSNELLAELRTMQSCVEKIASLLDKEGADFRLELVSLRRALGVHISAVRALLDGSAQLDPSVAMLLRSQLSSARTRLALHQSSWPAVKIDEDVEGYRSSGQEAIDALREFLRLAQDKAR